jgi:tetratricopeptide (TPR) repeat protein
VRPTIVAGLVFLFLPLPASAQRPLADVSTFPRPKLAADADTNSWLAYYNYGVARLRHSPDDAEAAFVWAARIDPSRAEPLMGRWVTYWRRDFGLFKRYLKDTLLFIKASEVIRVDSLLVRAHQRNPFAPPVLAIVLYERLGGFKYSFDEVSEGLRQYSAGDYENAAFHFDIFVARNRENYEYRYYTALCYIASRQYERAATEIAALLAEKGQRTSAHQSRVYQSQEQLWYGLGVLRLIIGDTTAARENLGQALTENLAFYPAHALLADIALARADTTQAVAEYAQAVELGPADGVLLYRSARLLADVGRLPDAEQELRRAIALEPFFAPPYLALALVLDTRGSHTEALEQYRRYLARTYRDDPRIALARARITALSQ